MLQQQHDGVVVVEQQYSGRASPSSYGGGEVLGRVLGNVAEIQNFPTCHQDQSMEFTSNERGGVHLHTLVDRERKRSRERG